ncbi:hypothetical protein ACIP1V_01855, partial [Kocuria marina]
ESFLEGSHGDRAYVVNDEPGHRELHHFMGHHSRRAKLDEAARERHTTPSQLMRELIDAL